MKHLLLIMFACISSIVLGETHPAHHSHTTSHCSHHHNESHPYSHVKHIVPSDIHFYQTTNNSVMYYYLLFNKNTNSNDTIKATSVSELHELVDTTSKEPDLTSGIAILVTVVGVALIAIWTKN